jgi:hypothetical protein
MKPNRDHAQVRWLLLIHQLPGEPAYLRVKVGRRLARVGAVALKNSVYLLPSNDGCREDFSWIRREIVDDGGEASFFEAATIEGLTNAEIERLFRNARVKEYDDLAHELGTLVTSAKLDKPQERQAMLAALARLDEQLSVIERVDFYPAGQADELREKLARARATVELRGGPRSAEPSSPRLRPEDYQSRTWVTRLGVKVDRVACAWLIRRFIDKTATLKFVNAATYTHRGQELRFDMPEAEFTHEGDLCSFEVLCRRFALSAAPLVRIAEIVHDLDIKDARYRHPETEGVRAFIEGVTLQYARDDARVEAASTLFDALLRVQPSGVATKRRRVDDRNKSARAKRRST